MIFKRSKPERIRNGRLIISCSRDDIFDTLSFEFLKHYRRVVLDKKKSKFDKDLIEAIKLNKIIMTIDSNLNKRGGKIIFEMKGTSEEIEKWTKFNFIDRTAIKVFSKTGVLKIKIEIDE